MNTMQTSGPVETTGGQKGQALSDAITKQANEGLTIRKAVSLREDADRELDTLAKAHSAEHGTNYYTSYEAVTQEGVGKSLMTTSLELSRLIANPTAVPAAD